MAELVRSVGESYESSLPVEIAAAVAPLILIIYCVVQLHDHEVESKLPYVVGVILAVVFYLQIPAAVESAKRHCEQEFEDAGGSYGFGSSVPLTYRTSKCANAWPDGPKSPAAGPIPLP
jgi:hypothetical protein